MANHYEVLGLPETASQDEVKRRFRELARRWHPDVARTPDAAEKFKTISEAYRVLGDPNARAQYDAELKLQAMRTAGASRAPGTSRRRASSEPAGPGPAPGRSETTSASQRAASEIRTVVVRLLRDADRAMQRMQLYEAEQLCRAILRLDRRNATAHEILGDICSMRGRTEAALAHYTMAVQLDPRNTRLRQKFERAAASESPIHTSKNVRSRGVASPAAQALAMMLGVGAIGAMIAIAGAYAPAPSSGSWVPWEWTPWLMFSLPTAGAVAGWTASYAGILRPARTELLVTTSSRQGRSVVPMGVILVILSVACFWLAAVLYAVVAATQEALSRSILLAFAVSACVVAMFAGVAPDSSGPILGFGGNMVFPAFVAGWALADRSAR